MKELYAEAGVKKKDTVSTMMLRVLLIVGIVVGGFLLFLGGIPGFLGAVLIVAMIFLFPKLNVEYEYVYVDGQLDFDKITGKAKRKTLLRIDFEQVEIMAPSGSHALDGYTYIQSEQKDFSSGDKTRKPYVIMASVEDKKVKILFEPSEKMIEVIKQKSPRKVSPY